MANAFDQFDAPAKTVSDNPFDQFDGHPPATAEQMKQEFLAASPQAKVNPYPMAKHGEPLDSDGVPQWGRDHPNLYGLYGAGKALANVAAEGAGG